MAKIRQIVATDVVECGRILHAAFSAIAEQHNFPPDFPSVDVATGVASMLIEHPGFYGVVAEQDGRILESNFIDLRSIIAGIGPITVDPATQDRGVGRRLMQAVMEHAAEHKHAGIRLVQAAYHNRSLCLYTRLGFATREPLSLIQGPPLGLSFPGYEVRPATSADLPTCAALHERVHGFDRSGEVVDAIREKKAIVVEHLGRITGYATEIGFFAHGVAETNNDLKALIGAASAFSGSGFLVPTRNHDLFAWCLDNGLRLSMQMTLMSTGLYAEPAGPYLPSILY
jgi:GNAT superfamily N-acetyltransferase